MNIFYNITDEEILLIENISLVHAILKTMYSTEESRKIYLLITLMLIVLGLIGHTITIFVFSQKRFRNNSSNVYLLCLAINDGIYLISHMFEDTVRTYIYLNQQNKMSEIILSLNIIDKYNLACLLINYLRYVLRFISAYIIVAFTIQRVFLVYTPFSTTFKSTKSGWKTVLLITIVSFVLNIWILFILEIKNDDNKVIYCDVKENWSKEYFHVTLIYICVIMLLPILVIFICNSIIITKIIKKVSHEKKRKRSFISSSTTSSNYYSNQQQQTFITKKLNERIIRTKRGNLNFEKLNEKNTKINFIIHRSSSSQNLANHYRDHHKNENRLLFLSDARLKRRECTNILNNSDFNLRIKPYYLNMNQIINKITERANNSKKITKMLLIISFSNALLNLPYFVCWTLNYYEIMLKNGEILIEQNNLYSALKISEIFYLMSFGVFFYIYYASGSVFRNQIKYSSKIKFYLLIHLLI